MYKNQLQELAQRSCFNLPSYTCFREGPDHAPRFKAAVNFNGETFESPSYCSTLRLAEHSAAEMALNALANRGPTNSLAARILDETGVYKNLLQEVSQRVGASLPSYTTFRTGLGHLPVFTGTVELAGVIFTGEPAKNKKQAEKNAAMAAWLSLKSLQQSESSTSEKTHKDEQEHVTVARAFHKYLIKARLARTQFPIKFPTLSPRPSSIQQPPPATTSKILPFICPRTAPRNRPVIAANSSSISPNIVRTTQSQSKDTGANEIQSFIDSLNFQTHKFPAAGAAPYIPVRHCNPHNRFAPPVTIRNTIPVFSAPPPPSPQSSLVMRPPGFSKAAPVTVRQAVPAYAASPIRIDALPKVHPAIKIEDPRRSISLSARADELPVSKAAASAPRFDVPKASVESPLKISSPAANSKASAAYETGIAVQCMLQEAREIEIPKSPVEYPPPKISSLASNSKASADETRIAVQKKLQESAEVEGFEDMKI